MILFLRIRQATLTSGARAKAGTGVPMQQVLKTAAGSPKYQRTTKLLFFFCVCAGKVKTIPAPKAQRVTLLNFFARGTMQPIRIQSSQAKKKKKHPPPKTRVAKYGRPLKQRDTALSRAEKVARMHQSVKRKFPDGVLLSTPTKRKEWSGAVRLLV